MISKNQIKFIHSLELKKNRQSEGLFIAEGPKVVRDLLAAGLQPYAIYSTCPLTNDGTNAAITLINEDELRRISLLQHPQKTLAVFHIPDIPFQQPDPHQLSLALDGVQDPGNLGTIIRIADWFGIKNIYCSITTADVYNPKVVQATMGSMAHVNVYYCELPALLSSCQTAVYGTLLDGDDIYSQTLAPEGIIVMGNEGNGISEAVRPFVDHPLLIPNFCDGLQTAESLNVAIATAITCSEFRRRQNSH